MVIQRLLDTVAADELVTTDQLAEVFDRKWLYRVLPQLLSDGRIAKTGDDWHLPAGTAHGAQLVMGAA